MDMLFPALVLPFIIVMFLLPPLAGALGSRRRWKQKDTQPLPSVACMAYMKFTNKVGLASHMTARRATIIGMAILGVTIFVANMGLYDSFKILLLSAHLVFHSVFFTLLAFHMYCEGRYGLDGWSGGGGNVDGGIS